MMCVTLFMIFDHFVQSLEFLKPEDAQNVRKRLFELTILTHSQNISTLQTIL